MTRPTHILAALLISLPSVLTAGPAENAKTSERFFDALNAGDMATLVSTMSEDVVTYEPVGTPANIGHDGVMAWAAANAQMGFKSVVVDVRDIHSGPTENAVVWTTRFVLPSDEAVEIDGVDLHRFNDAGQITEVRAFFDPTPLMQAMSR